MVNFYGFYTTYAFILTILSGIALGFILEKYNTVADSSCNVEEYKLNYNLKELMMFLLISTIGSNLFHIVGYFTTRQNESSCLRKLIIFTMFIIFVIQCIGSFTMIDKFRKTHSCFSFYEDNNKCILISFIVILCVYVFQTLVVLIGCITNICCSERRNKYSTIDYGYANP